MTGGTLRVRLADGAGEVEFDPGSVAGSGGEKMAFFTPDRRRVVLFFYGPLPDRDQRRQRLTALLGPRNLTRGANGAFWARHYFWPTGIIDGDPALPAAFLQTYRLANPPLGLTAETYPPEYFFRHANGNLVAKDGKWFTGNKARRHLPVEERGDLHGYLRVCIAMTRAVRRLHYAGLAHADLSNKNVLIDPRRGAARLLDLDSLVVPGFAPPTVLGTPGYIAPEVLAGTGAPGIPTDQHALAVLIYETLLVRHPLRGPRVHDPDPETDERLSLGVRAQFVEDPDDRSNRLHPPPAVPYTCLGPYLGLLFLRAFGPGLLKPAARPGADDWERALYKTCDLLMPTPDGRDWMVLAPGMTLRCPYTHAPVPGPVWFAQCYRPRPNEREEFQREDQGITVHHGRRLMPWHVRAKRWPDESAETANPAEVGVFARVDDGRWYLMNNDDAPMQVIGGPTLNRGEHVELTDGLKVLLSFEEDGRLLIFQPLT